GTRLAANGIPAGSGLPPHTIGRSARLAPVVGHIPIIAQLVSHGLTYIEAVNEYWCMAHRQANLAISTCRANQQLGLDSASAISRRSIRIGFFDNQQSIAISDTSFVAQMLTGIPIHIVVPRLTPVHAVRDPCTSPPDSSLVKSLRAS